MAKYSNDVDLLKWEPVVFHDLAYPSQTLCCGADGVISGTAFTSPTGSFLEAGVSAGHVIVVQSGELAESCYEVASVEGPTELKVSVVRANTTDALIAPPAATGVQFRISTFDPQAEEAAYSLHQYFGLTGAGEVSLMLPAILNERSLRQASAYAVLAAVFTSSACGQPDPSGYWEKAARYQTLFEAARSRARVELDRDQDNRFDEVRTGGVVRLRRL